MESKTLRLFYRAHQPGGGGRSTAACSVSAAVNERAGEMQQRILHGVTAVKAFISPLNHNVRSQYFFFFLLLLSWCFMEFRGPVFCLFGFLSRKRRFSFIIYFFFTLLAL